MIQWIEGAAFLAGVGLSAVSAVFPRLGAGSRLLLYLLLPASFSAAIQAFGLAGPDSERLSLSLITVAAAGGYLASCTSEQKGKRRWAIPVCAMSVLLAGLLYFAATSPSEAVPEDYLALGPIGYAAGLFLLIISIVVLTCLEQTLRHSSETVRWELKFLFLGVGSLYAAIIYMSSQVLLFPPSKGLLPTGSIKLFHIMFLISCALIALSWKRASGRSKIAVSHGAIYSSLTLLSVGIYLIASSLIARWAADYGELGLPMEALIFLLSAIGLAAILLGTGFRHRTRAWIRRNIFAGRYDYRQFWLEATEKVRSIDPPPAMAAALADIVHRALGAIDVSVWVRRWNPTSLHLLGSLGPAAGSLEKEAAGVVEEMLHLSEPVSLDDLESMPNAGAVRDFALRTGASLLVPLPSSNRIVGVISVGADRSGRTYDVEAREFMRALGGHAAGEFHKSDLLATLVEAKKDEAFRAFSTFVLHDLKNFASTLSYIAQNAPKHQHNPEFQKDAFQSVFDTAEKMKRLCSSLRTFSTTLAADKKPQDLNELVRSVADTLNAGMRGRLKLDLQPVAPIMADPEELARVMQNLLINAREAIRQDGAIIVRTGNVKDKVECCVEDDGAGMSRDFLEKELFQPFHTTKSGGLGIGLFQSKKIVEAHRGSISVESTEGKGTKVTLAFSAIAQRQDPPQARQAAQS